MLDDDAEDIKLDLENDGLSYDWIDEVLGPLELLSVIFVSSLFVLFTEEDDDD